MTDDAFTRPPLPPPPAAEPAAPPAPHLLSAADILGFDDTAVEDVPVPEWNGTVRIRGLNGTQRDRFEFESVQLRGRQATANMDNLRARLVALCAIDAGGRRLFHSEDVRALGKKNAAALDRLFSAAQRLSGLDDNDVEVLLGNSEPGQDASSTSG